MTPPAFTLELAGGARAVVVESDGDTAVLHSSVASPPGSTLAGTAADGSGSYRVKVRGCKRLDAEQGSAYRIEGRFVSLTRAQREQVLLQRGTGNRQ